MRGLTTTMCCLGEGDGVSEGGARHDAGGCCSGGGAGSGCTCCGGTMPCRGGCGNNGGGGTAGCTGGGDGRRGGCWCFCSAGARSPHDEGAALRAAAGTGAGSLLGCLPPAERPRPKRCSRAARLASTSAASGSGSGGCSGVVGRRVRGESGAGACRPVVSTTGQPAGAFRQHHNEQNILHSLPLECPS